LSFSDGRILYVANGMDNALAVIELGKDEYAKALNPKSKVIGFIPTGAYPSGIAISDKGNLYVSNLEAEGARLGIHHARTANLIYNSHNMMASISVIPVPGKKKLDAYTDTVIAVNNLSRAMSSREKPRESVKAKPVPERIGEATLFKHVVYIIKENRTYDQVLGDMKKA